MLGKRYKNILSRSGFYFVRLNQGVEVKTALAVFRQRSVYLVIQEWPSAIRDTGIQDMYRSLKRDFGTVKKVSVLRDQPSLIRQ